MFFTLKENLIYAIMKKTSLVFHVYMIFQNTYLSLLMATPWTLPHPPLVTLLWQPIDSSHPQRVVLVALDKFLASLGAS